MCLPPPLSFRAGPQIQRYSVGTAALARLPGACGECWGRRAHDVPGLARPKCRSVLRARGPRSRRSDRPYLFIGMKTGRGGGRGPNKPRLMDAPSPGQKHVIWERVSDENPVTKPTPLFPLLSAGSLGGGVRSVSRRTAADNGRRRPKRGRKISRAALGSRDHIRSPSSGALFPAPAPDLVSCFFPSPP